MARNTPKPTVISKKHLARLERERRQTMAIHYTAIGVILAVILILGFGYLNIKVLSLRQPVAKVGDDMVTTHEFQIAVRFARIQLINQYNNMLQFAQMFGIDPYSNPSISQQLEQITSSLDAPVDSSGSVGMQVLDNLVNDRLIQQEAERREILITNDEVEEAIRANFDFYPNGTPTPTITPTVVIFPTLSPKQLAWVTITPTPTPVPTFTPLPTTIAPDLSATPVQSLSPTPAQMPTPTATPYTLEGYQQAFQKYIEQFKPIGMTESDYHKMIEASLYREKVFDAITANVPHENEMIWARHILVADEAAAQDIHQRLLKGEEFAKLAAELSQDPGSRENGGDLGWFSKGQMVPEFETAAFSLKVGDISQPVKSNYGYHIIQVLGHEMRPLTADEYEQARQNAFQQWLTKAHEATEVTIYEYWKERIPADPTLPAQNSGQ